MEKQSYKNHIRFYTPHHFVFYPILLFLVAISIYFASTSDDTLIWSFITIIFIVLIALAFMLRQHYALTLQNRIVRLELRYRYFSLTGDKFEPFEQQLDDAQIFALRFAPDDELPVLVSRTLSENLSGKQIKKAIINWRADHDRV